jgi:pimeloyl-ACP methyl ester carboxylesterase
MQIVRAMWEFPTYERYRQVRCPALLLPAISPDPDDAGEQEYLVLKQRGVQKAQQFLPQVHLHWMKNTIHDIPLQRPARLARLISEFAQSLP